MKQAILLLCILASVSCYGIDLEKFNDIKTKKYYEMDFTRSLAVYDLLIRTQNSVYYDHNKRMQNDAHQENLKTIFLVEIKVNEQECKKQMKNLKDAIESNEDILMKCDEHYREDIINSLNFHKIELENLEELYIHLCEIQRNILNESLR